MDSSLLAEAVSDLDSAWKASQDDLQKALCKLWIGRVHLYQATETRLTDVSSVEQLALAEEACQLAVEGTRRLGAFDWPDCQMVWAEVALKQPELKEARTRTHELVAKLHSTQKMDVPVRPSVLERCVEIRFSGTDDAAQAVEQLEQSIGLFSEDGAGGSLSIANLCTVPEQRNLGWIACLEQVPGEMRERRRGCPADCAGHSQPVTE